MTTHICYTTPCTLCMRVIPPLEMGLTFESQPGGVFIVCISEVNNGKYKVFNDGRAKAFDFYMGTIFKLKRSALWKVARTGSKGSDLFTVFEWCGRMDDIYVPKNI